MKPPINILDITRNSKLSDKDSKILDSLEVSILDDYNFITKSFIDQNSLRGLNLLISPACRNPYENSILDTISKVALIEKKFSEHHPLDFILVDNFVVKDLLIQLQQHHPEYRNLKVKVKLADLLTYAISRINFTFIRLLKCIYLSFNQWFWIKFFNFKKIPTTPMVFIHNYILPESIDEFGSYHDRYFTDYDDFFTSNELKNHYISPTLFRFRHPSDFINFWKKIQKTDRNFLFSESFLSLFDYIKSIYFSFKKPKKEFFYPKIRGIDLKELFKESLNRDIASMTLMTSFQRYIYISKLKKNNIPIKGALCWFENLSIDRALCLSIKKNYPAIEIKGYQAFFSPPFEAHKNPTDFEQSLETLPHTIGVISRVSLSQKKALCPSQDFFLAPPFRFNYLHQTLKKINKDSIDILVVLPMDIQESIELIQVFLGAKNNIDPSLKITIKHHPVHKTDEFSRYVPAFGDSFFRQSKEDFSSLLPRSNLLVTSASSVSLEALSMNIPVLIYANTNGLTRNPIPNNFMKDYWKVFYTSQELFESMELFASMDKKIKVNQLIHEVNEKEARALFFC
jgi:hypothetical protein